jgi:hypothetical protein
LRDKEVIEDGLNPLTINQIPKNISFKIMGITKIKFIITPASRKINVKINIAPISPQIDINLGMSFDLYNK